MTTNQDKNRWLAMLVLLTLVGLVIAATVVTPGKKISEYPRVTTLSDTDLLVAGRTNAAVPTNVGIAASSLFVQATNGLASTSYVTTTVTGAVATLPAELWTNSGGIVRLTTNGPVSIASTGLLGGLVVTQDMRILGHNVASNYIWVATNATTGEGEWRDISALLTPVGIIPRTNLLNIQYEPVRGSTWYAGTNGIPTTNEARAGLEFSPFWRSLRMGEVAAGPDPILGYLGNGSNYWNNTNIGVCSVGFGSNAFTKAPFSSVLGGVYNGIREDAKFSVIGGGIDNLIDTNAIASVISGGGGNSIRTAGAISTEVGNTTIGGGSNNVVSGITVKNSTISGGANNTIFAAREATISGGIGNTIREDGRFGFIGGGINNQIGEVAGTPSASESSVIGGGSGNATRGDFCFIGGGQDNVMLATGDNYGVICGGQDNNIGLAGSSLSTYGFIGGGLDNDINNASHYSVMVGGRGNNVGGNDTNCVIVGGYLNLIHDNAKFSMILGGEQNSVSATYAFSIGNSNSITASRAGAIGMNVTNATAGSVTVGELISYNTPAVISGAGTGSTNYLLAVTSPKMLLGSSNVHIYGVSGTIAGKTHNWSVNITNLSGDTWGIGFSSGTNRWKFQSWMYGTNAPAVLTNNTLLRLNGESEGTNTLVTYEYFSPAL